MFVFPSLYERLGGLLDDPATRHAFACRSREIFEDKFTSERNATRMLDLYTRVVDDHRSKRRGRDEPA